MILFFFDLSFVLVISLEKLLLIFGKVVGNFCSIPEYGSEYSVFLFLSLFLVSRDFSRYLVKYVRGILAEFIIRLNIKIPYS